MKTDYEPAEIIDDSSDEEVNKKEVEFILKYKSNDSSVLPRPLCTYSMRSISQDPKEKSYPITSFHTSRFKSLG